MLFRIDDKELIVQFLDEKLRLPEDIENEINDYFKQLKAQGLNIWNGEIVCVSDYQIDGKITKVTCKKSNYAHYLYAEKIGIEPQYQCKNISAGCILETVDGFYVIGELGNKTSFPGMLQTTGGNIDIKQDIQNGKIDLMNTIDREAKEELNIDLDDPNLVDNHVLTYMYEEETDKQRGIRILSKAKIKMTSTELKAYFEEYNAYLMKNNLELEFDKLLFIPKDRAMEELNKYNNPKREYMMEILKYESNL